MARPRAHNLDICCPECGSNRMPQNGVSPGRQVCRCGDCGRYYTHGAAYTHPAFSRLRRRGRLRREGAAGRQPAAVIALDEMRTRQQAWRGAGINGRICGSGRR